MTSSSGRATALLRDFPLPVCTCCPDPVGKCQRHLVVLGKVTRKPPIVIINCLLPTGRRRARVPNLGIRTGFSRLRTISCITHGYRELAAIESGEIGRTSAVI